VLQAAKIKRIGLIKSMKTQHVFENKPIHRILYKTFDIVNLPVFAGPIKDQQLGNCFSNSYGSFFNTQRAW
jgi:hypothetical protein